MNKVLNITKALADESRVRGVFLLKNGELCVCQIIEVLELAPSTVSKHMSILKQAGLVDTRRAGKWTYYRLANETADLSGVEILSWLLRRLEDDPKIIADSIRLAEIRSRTAVAKTCPRCGK